MKKIAAPPQKVLVAAQIAPWLDMSVRHTRRRIREWVEQGRLQPLPEPGRHRSQQFDAGDVARCFVEDEGAGVEHAINPDEAQRLAEAFDHAIDVVLAYEELVGDLTVLVDATERRKLSPDDASRKLAELLGRIHARAADLDEDDPAFSATFALRYAKAAGFLDDEAEEDDDPT